MFNLHLLVETGGDYGLISMLMFIRHPSKDLNTLKKLHFNECALLIFFMVIYEFIYMKRGGGAWLFMHVYVGEHTLLF